MMALCKLRMFLLLAFISPDLMMATDEAMEIDSEGNELSVFFAGLAINDSEQLGCNVLNFHNWTENQLILLLNDKTYRELESTLIKNLENALLKHADRLGITSPEKLLSFYLAHHEINLSFCHNNIVPHPAFLDQAKDTAQENAYEAFVSAREQFQIKFPSAQRKLVELGGHKVGCLSVRLSNIFRLVFSAQEGFMELFFNKAYNKALLICQTSGLCWSKQQVLDFIGKDSWCKENIASNNRVISLKRMMETLALRVN